MTVETGHDMAERIELVEHKKELRRLGRHLKE